MRHAFLISAHAYYDQLKILVDCLDAPQNDIYIHINLASDLPDMLGLTKDIKHSHVKLIKTRIPIFWGNNGLMCAGFALLEEATRIKYSYYHFLSVQDLPIKNINYIHTFFEKNLHNNSSKKSLDTNYVTVQTSPNMLRPRVCQYNLFITHWRDTNIVSKTFFKGLNYCFRVIQKLVGIDRVENTGLTLYQGDPWWSITHEFALYYLSKKDICLDLFDKYSFAADEFAIQTVIGNSDYKNTVYTPRKSDTRSCMRKIDFKRGNGLGSPHIWTITDYEELMKSDALFARKFDIHIDKQIIDILLKIMKG